MGEVLQCLKTLEIPFNINNKQQLNKLSELGFSQTSTTFSNSVKLGSHIRAAQSYGVNTLYCDSVEELAKIKKFHGSSK
jgi:diaminopimelate decarboxylase